MSIGQRVAKRLRALIRIRQTTAERLAYETGISKGNLSEILRGKRSPTLRTLDKLARTLDVPTWHLLVDPDTIRQPR